MPEHFEQLIAQLQIIDIEEQHLIVLLLAILFLLVGGYVIYFIGQRLVLPLVKDVLGYFKPEFLGLIDKPLNKLMGRLALLLPLIFWIASLDWFIGPDMNLTVILQKGFFIYFYFNVALLCLALLTIIGIIYNQQTYAKEIPLEGVIQIVKLLIILLFFILASAELLGKSPLFLLSGLGALTAVLLIIFRDTILGLVAGIQIASHRLVANGDWITMDQYGADGEVLEVGLHSVQISNWDKTITTIPTHKLISESFKNWRGMSQSGGRRIKRAIRLDIRSIVFIDDTGRQQIKSQLKQMPTVVDLRSLDEPGIDDKWQQAQTNLALFRIYIEGYLLNHPQTNKEMTLMVRQLQPTELGLPIEIYCFCTDKRWVYYEQAQAGMIEHALALLPIFGLKAYQLVGAVSQDPTLNP